MNRVHTHQCSGCEEPLTCVCSNMRELPVDGRPFRVWCRTCGEIKDALGDREEEMEVVKGDAQEREK